MHGKDASGAEGGKDVRGVAWQESVLRESKVLYIEKRRKREKKTGKRKKKKEEREHGEKRKRRE